MSLAGERASEVKKVWFFIMDIPADSSPDIQMKASHFFSVESKANQFLQAT